MSLNKHKERVTGETNRCQ